MFSLIRQRIAFASLLSVCVIALSVASWAHAILMDSTPKANAVVKGPTVEVTLRFNVRIDGGRSRIQLQAPDGTLTNATLAKQSSADLLQCTLSGLKPGSYKLKWNVLASDGHMSRGEVPFTVN